MILAEGAAQIAAVTPDRQNQTPRMKARQRLLFDRIQGKRRDPAVVRSCDRTIPADPRAAEADLPLPELTMSETDLTDCHGFDPFHLSRGVPGFYA